MPSNSISDNQVVYTLNAKCRDCYRCLKVCPVKAIKMAGNQAYVIDELCIACGTCIRECPQGAKSYRNDLLKVKKLLQGPEPAAVSLAPSFAAFYPEEKQKQLCANLRKAGFQYIGETAIGAYPVALATSKYREEYPYSPLISTACPAVVNYIQKYEPDLCELLIPVASPMITHMRQIRENYQRPVKTVFIGPCVAKKTEADQEKNRDVIDAVLTFDELNEWLEQAGIPWTERGTNDFNELPLGEARLFPLPGGLLQTAALAVHGLDQQLLTIHGLDALKEVIKGIKQKALGPCLIEPLFCLEGCINGPGVKSPVNLYERKKRVIQYHAKTFNRTTSVPAGELAATPSRLYVMSYPRPKKPLSEKKIIVSEELILVTLRRTGKEDKENQLNCGACGYPSCREKAIAVLNGMAEEQMCLPYMRRLAEQRTDKIIETLPSGVVILDDQFRIIKMNPAFRNMFKREQADLNAHISDFLDPHPFEQLSGGLQTVVELSSHFHEQNGLICHEIYYQIEEEKQFVGIFFNITDYQKERKQYEDLKKETIVQAKELLNHQIDMAQRIAQFLGTNTAKSEDLLRKLMQLAGEY